MPALQKFAAATKRVGVAVTHELVNLREPDQRVQRVRRHAHPRAERHG